MSTLISEDEFRCALLNITFPEGIKSVTGPGRSGAIAAVYASHILGVPFIPFGQTPPEGLHKLLIIDTAIKTGRTLRKAVAKYAILMPFWTVECIQSLAVFGKQENHLIFWYESAYKPEPRQTIEFKTSTARAIPVKNGERDEANSRLLEGGASFEIKLLYT